MLYLIKWLYMWILPLGSIVAALAIVTVYQFRRHAEGWTALAGILVIVYILSISPTVHYIVQPLETMYNQPAVQELHGDVIILLGGGARAGVPDVDGVGQVGEAAANRFLTAVRLQKMLHVPILLSGGAVLPGDASEGAIEKRMLRSLGVDESMIYVDEQSRNTAENAAFSRELCRQYGWNHPIVVTSAFHMPRAVAFFQRQHMDVTPYPCDYRTSADERLSPYSFIPQAFVLFTACLAIKEYVGLAAAKLGLQ